MEIVKRSIAAASALLVSLAVIGVMSGHTHGSDHHAPRCIASLVRLAACDEGTPLSILHLDAYQSLVNALVVAVGALALGLMVLSWWSLLARIVGSPGKLALVPLARGSPWRRPYAVKIRRRFHRWLALHERGDAAVPNSP